MIKTSVISKNYAKALIEAAGETGEYTKYYSQLEDVLNTLENSPDLQIVMANSAIAVSKKIEIINEIFENKIDRKLLNFLKILIRKNRFNEIEAIKEIFEDEISKLSNKTKVEITSPIELNFENNIDPIVLYNSLHECKNFTDKEFEYILKESQKNIKNKKISY